jgi:hypothetical protein
MAAARNSRLKVVETIPDPVETPGPRALRRVGRHAARGARAAGLERSRARRQHLKIRRVHLEAIEAGRFAALPGPDLRRHKFVRAYAEALGLDPEEIGPALPRRGRRSRPLGSSSTSRSRSPRAALPRGSSCWCSVVIAGLGYGAWTQFNKGGRVALPRVEAVPQNPRRGDLPPAAPPIPPPLPKRRRSPSSLPPRRSRRCRPPARRRRRPRRDAGGDRLPRRQRRRPAAAPPPVTRAPSFATPAGADAVRRHRWRASSA